MPSPHIAHASHLPHASVFHMQLARCTGAHHPTHAQTAGILVGSVRNFSQKVILAKVTAAIFESDVFPGQSIRYDATIDRIDDMGASTMGTISRFDPARRGMDRHRSHRDHLQPCRSKSSWTGFARTQFRLRRKFQGDTWRIAVGA